MPKIDQESLQAAHRGLAALRIVHDLAKANAYKAAQDDITDVEKDAYVIIEMALKDREEVGLNKLAFMLGVTFEGPIERYYGVIAKALEEASGTG